MADAARGTVAVIGQAADHHCYARRTVAFVGNLLKALAFQCACALLNSALDVILGNVVSLSLGQGQLQLHIAGRVRAAHTHGNGNLSADLSGDLAAQSVSFAFFMFNVCPFRMS